jgi:dual specificity MAP kinase phosphatase
MSCSANARSQYLGNLNHASNALMLKALGITHVVSMGESALTPPRPAPFSLFSRSSPTSTSSSPTNSLWLEERLGSISVLDMKNVADDGIDSIRPYIDQALAFIDEARWSGGKVLVHCRVGVSRSASIVIAYLMKHVELDLASAYLLTRSRRLNILIQVSCRLSLSHSLSSLGADEPR